MTIIGIVLLNITLTTAAFAKITSPEKGEFLEGTITIKGFAVEEENAQFQEWKLELGSLDDENNFIPQEILASSQQPAFTTFIDPQDPDTIYQDPTELATLDLNTLSRGKHTLRLRATEKLTDQETGETEMQEYENIVSFYKSQKITLKLKNSEGKDFNDITILIRNKNNQEELFAVGPEGARVLGNGNPDPEKGPLTVCTSSCDLIIDLFYLEEKVQQQVDIFLVAEDSGGIVYAFADEFDESATTLSFDTSSTREVQALQRTRTLFQGKQIEEYSLSFRDILFTPASPEDELKLKVSVSKKELMYPYYAFIIHYYIRESGKIIPKDIPLFYPFEDTEIQALMPFIRGDANNDGVLSITDPIALLGYLFLGKEKPICEDAADSNDDGKIGLTDAVYVLNYLFSGGAQPPEPQADSLTKLDTTPDDFLCLETLK